MAGMYLYCHILLAVFIAGLSCESSFSSQVQHTQPENGGDVKQKLKGSYELSNYGIVTKSRWTKTDDVSMVHVTMLRCYNLHQCLRIGQLREYPGQPAHNFHILPSGQIVKSTGWDRNNLGHLSINHVPVGMEELQLTTEALEAYAFLMQVGVSLGKVHKSFKCKVSEEGSHAVILAEEIKKWCHSYRNIFDKDLLVYRTPADGDEEVVSRSDWDPMEPTRDMDSIEVEAEVVQVHLTYLPCSSLDRCTEAAQELRREQTKKHGDLIANFIFGGDGRVYEGLGWNSTRVEKVLQIHFIVDSEDSAPRKMSLSVFSLLISDGVMLGRISEEFKLDLTSIANGTVAEKIEKWVAWSRKAFYGRFVITVPSAAGEERQDAIEWEQFHPLRHPIGRVLLTTSSGDVDDVPFVRSTVARTMRSAKEVRSNFYFAGDEVAYEGLGWNQTATVDEVVFEFLIPDSEVVPSNQSMLVSTFLLREGVKKGFLRADYELSVAEHTSVKFENMVRLWDGRVRGDGDFDALTNLQMYGH